MTLDAHSFGSIGCLWVLTMAALRFGTRLEYSLLVIFFASIRSYAVLMDGCAKWGNETCSCGPQENGKKVNITVQMCTTLDGISGKRMCVPCYRTTTYTEHPCNRFSHCETCCPGSRSCKTCPPGRIGKFCDIEIRPYDPDPISAKTFNQSHDLMAQDSGSRNLTSAHRVKKRKILCDYPMNLRTQHMICFVDDHEVRKCHMKCIWGHSFSNGRVTKDVVCYYRTNKWIPDPTEKCKRFVNCQLRLLDESADMYCTGPSKNFPNRQDTCQIRCPKEKIAGRDKITYTCDLNGEWSPPLPNCVTVDQAYESIASRPQCRNDSVRLNTI